MEAKRQWCSNGGVKSIQMRNCKIINNKRKPKEASITKIKITHYFSLGVMMMICVKNSDIIQHVPGSCCASVLWQIKGHVINLVLPLRIIIFCQNWEWSWCFRLFWKPKISNIELKYFFSIISWTFHSWRVVFCACGVTGLTAILSSSVLF